MLVLNTGILVYIIIGSTSQASGFWFPILNLFSKSNFGFRDLQFFHDNFLMRVQRSFQPFQGISKEMAKSKH